MPLKQAEERLRRVYIICANRCVRVNSDKTRQLCTRVTWLLSEPKSCNVSVRDLVPHETLLAVAPVAKRSTYVVKRQAIVPGGWTSNSCACIWSQLAVLRRILFDANKSVTVIPGGPVLVVRVLAAGLI